ncbi:MAG: flagellar assembly protein FliW [Cellulosilyticum sp.]|nr:flagellar assembly protein FliW [Cellulosilyticum sp.]
MKMNTRNFGEIEINKDKIITFKEGIPGFEELHQFIFMDSQNPTFHYLQSIENGDICFVIVNPYELKQDYAPIINEEYFEKLGGGSDKQFALYSIVCLKNPIEESTVNLAGPLVIHIENKLGIQVVTEEKMYSTRHKLVDLKREGE